MASWWSSTAGGKRHTVNSVPRALKRLYCLFVSLSIVNLGTTSSSDAIPILFLKTNGRHVHFVLDNASFQFTNTLVLTRDSFGCDVLHSKGKAAFWVPIYTKSWCHVCLQICLLNYISRPSDNSNPHSAPTHVSLRLLLVHFVSRSDQGTYITLILFTKVTVLRKLVGTIRSLSFQMDLSLAKVNTEIQDFLLSDMWTLPEKLKNVSLFLLEANPLGSGRLKT